jgi:hypothetical protein
MPLSERVNLGKLGLCCVARGCTRPISHLRLWRQQRANGALSGRERGRPALGKKDARDLEFEALQRVNDDLTEKLRQSELIIEVQKNFRDDQPAEDRQNRLDAAEALAQQVGVRKACETLSVSHATLYRKRLPKPVSSKPRLNHRSLDPAEVAVILFHLNSEAFVDQSPRFVYANLLDQGIRLCSVRTMYRILHRNDATRERHDQLSHPTYTKPELLAVTPNQVWSWDITKLKGPEKWTYFHL